MKRIFTKIMLGFLLLSSTSSVMYSGLGQSLQNRARTALQGMGNNVGPLAISVAAFSAGFLSYWWRYNANKQRCEAM